jgi:hypothetical protein
LRSPEVYETFSTIMLIVVALAVIWFTAFVVLKLYQGQR